MLDRAAVFTLPFVEQGQVVVGFSACRVEPKRQQILNLRLLYSSSIAVQIRQIRHGIRVAEIDLQRTFEHSLRFTVTAHRAGARRRGCCCAVS